MFGISLTTFLTSTALILTTIALYVYRKSSYWKRRNVPAIGTNILWGDFKNLFLQKESGGESMSTHYRKYKHLRYTGSFQLFRPTLFIHDPEIIKEVLTKQASKFNGRGVYYDAEKDPLSANLFNLEGPEWKSMRNKLTPAFTSGKIKFMYNTMLECIANLERYMEKQLAGKSHIVMDSREVMEKVATDVILSIGFGIVGNTLENPDSEFGKVSKALTEPSLEALFKVVASVYMHPVCKILNLKALPKIANDFFMRVIKDTMAYRETNGVRRNDFLDLMMRLKNHGTLREGEIIQDKSEGHFLSANEVASQAFFFYNAGFETTSSTLSFTLFEIAKHPEIQKKLHEECDAAVKASNESGKISYETLQSLQYIEMVLQESQRLHSVVPTLMRTTSEPCTLPLADGVQLDKGTIIIIPVDGLQHDPDYFPDPQRFDPERFSPENKASIQSHVFLPFGEGSRMCIGSRLSMIVMKAALVSILSKHNLELAEGTPTEIEWDPKGILPVPKFPLKLKVTSRQTAD